MINTLQLIDYLAHFRNYYYFYLIMFLDVRFYSSTLIKTISLISLLIIKYPAVFDPL